MGRPFTLCLVATAFAGIGLLVLLLACVVGLGIITWDVKGYLLTGGVLALFAVAIAGVGLLAIAAAIRLWQGRPSGRLLALSFWVAAGMLALITDRAVEGPGEPLGTYLLDLMLLPGSITALLLWGIPSVRRFVRQRRSNPGAAAA